MEILGLKLTVQMTKLFYWVKRIEYYLTAWNKLQTSDLGNLLSLYAEWHSQLIPYYSFDHFVHKLEQVGGSKRVKVNTSSSYQLQLQNATYVLLLPVVKAKYKSILLFFFFFL